MKNFKKVLRNVLEAVIEQLCAIPNYGEVRRKMCLQKQFLFDFEKV